MRPRFRLALYAIAALAAVATAVVVGYRLRPTPAVQPATTFSVLPPAGTAFANIAVGGPPTISPDGRVIAFVAGSAGQRQIWLRRLGSLEATALADTEGASTPFWSADGGSLGFLVAGRLKKIDVSGGRSEVIASDVTNQIGSGSWNAENAILFSPRGANLTEVSAAGGPVTPVTTMDPSLMEENHVWPEWLPDGRHYLYHVRAGTQLELQVYIGERGSRNRTLLLTGVSRAQYAPPREHWPGHLLYVRDGTLLARPFDADGLAFTAPEVAIANNVATTAVGTGGDFSVAPNGTLAYRTGDAAAQELAWFNRQGESTTAAAKRPGRIGAGMRLSPDGTAAAYTWLAGQQPDIYLVDFIPGSPTRFTRFTNNTGAAPAWSPIWSPDGREVAFLRKDGIYRKSADQQGNETLLWKDDRVLAVNDWSGDGRMLLVTRWDKDAGRGLWLVPVDRSDAGSGPSPDRTPVFLHAPAMHGQFSPGNRAPAYVIFDSDEEGRNELFVKAMPGQAPFLRQITNDGGVAARWRRDGRELLYMGPTGLMAVDIDMETSFRHDVPQRLFPSPRGLVAATALYAPSYDVAPDGSKFLLPAPGPDTPAAAIHVVLNWQAKLPR